MNLMTKLWYTFAVKRDVVKEPALALHRFPFPTYWYSPPCTLRPYRLPHPQYLVSLKVLPAWCPFELLVLLTVRGCLCPHATWLCGYSSDTNLSRQTNKKQKEHQCQTDEELMKELFFYVCPVQVCDNIVPCLWAVLLGGLFIIWWCCVKWLHCGVLCLWLLALFNNQSL